MFKFSSGYPSLKRVNKSKTLNWDCPEISEHTFMGIRGLDLVKSVKPKKKIHVDVLNTQENLG